MVSVHTDSKLFDDLCALAINAADPVVASALMREVDRQREVVLPDQEEIDTCVRDCACTLASSWLEVLRSVLPEQSGDVLLLHRNFLPANVPINHHIYHALIDNVSPWNVTEAGTHQILKSLGALMFQENQSEFMLPLGMAIKKVSEGYAARRIRT